MKKLYLIPVFLFLLLLSSLTINSCSGGLVIPEPVCEYGEITCNTINYLCSTYPQIPPAVCDLSNIACTALNVLCNTNATPEAKEAAKISMEYVLQPKFKADMQPYSLINIVF